MHNQGDSDDDVGENNDNDGHDGNDVGCIYRNGDFNIDKKKEARFERNLNFKYFADVFRKGGNPPFRIFYCKKCFSELGGTLCPPLPKVRHFDPGKIRF